MFLQAIPEGTASGQNRDSIPGKQIQEDLNPDLNASLLRAVMGKLSLARNILQNLSYKDLRTLAEALPQLSFVCKRHALEAIRVYVMGPFCKIEIREGVLYAVTLWDWEEAKEVQVFRKPWPMRGLFRFDLVGQRDFLHNPEMAKEFRDVELTSWDQESLDLLSQRCPHLEELILRMERDRPIWDRTYCPLPFSSLARFTELKRLSMHMPKNLEPLPETLVELYLKGMTLPGTWPRALKVLVLNCKKGLSKGPLVLPGQLELLGLKGLNPRFRVDLAGLAKLTLLNMKGMEPPEQPLWGLGILPESLELVFLTLPQVHIPGFARLDQWPDLDPRIKGFGPLNKNHSWMTQKLHNAPLGPENSLLARENKI